MQIAGERLQFVVFIVFHRDSSMALGTVPGGRCFAAAGKRRLVPG